MNTNKPSLRAKLRYRFENTLSAGTIAIIGWLAVISLFVIFIAAAAIELFRVRQEADKPVGFFEAMWAGLMHALDAGTLGGDNGIAYRFIMLFVTIAGIFVVSTLIGVLTSGFASVIDELRKGKTKVMEKDHTLILGWSPKIFDIINELIIANESLRRSYIVILANRDKVTMEDDIRSKITNTKTTRIICRTGSPLETSDIDVANPNDARSIIIISPDDELEPDTHVIKSVLAITNHPNRRQTPYHLVAEIANEDNIEAAALVGGTETSFIFVEDLLSRITAQTCRQSGLSVVYTELLNFDGDEIYFKEEPHWVGKTFKEVMFGYEQSTVIGIQRKAGEVLLNLPSDTLIQDGDKIVAIAEDDSTLHYSNTPFKVDKAKLSTETAARGILPIERTFIIGWNTKGNKIIKELENYVSEGSEVVILSEAGSHVHEDIAIFKDKAIKQTIQIHEGIITKKADLLARKPETFDHIIVLSNEHNNVQEADAKTLIALLHLRNMAAQANSSFSIISEMRDIRNKYLAEVAKIDDFIVGANLISLILAQLSENKDLRLVFDNLLSADGEEIYLHPASDYIKVNEEVDFYAILEAASLKGEVPIGYKLGKYVNDAKNSYGIVINPPKSNKITFLPTDKIIVISDK